MGVDDGVAVDREGAVSVMVGVGDGVSAGVSIETESCGTANGASVWCRLIKSSPAALVERIRTLVPCGIFTKPMDAPFAIMSILASFTRVPERAGAAAIMSGTANKPATRITALREWRRMGRGFMGPKSILGS